LKSLVVPVSIPLPSLFFSVCHAPIIKAYKRYAFQWQHVTCIKGEVGGRNRGSGQLCPSTPKRTFGSRRGNSDIMAGKAGLGLYTQKIKANKKCCGNLKKCLKNWNHLHMGLKVCYERWNYVF